MSPQSRSCLHELLTNYPQLIALEANILSALDALVACAQRDGTVLVCGNGGSAADAEHIVGELMKGFLSRRRIPDHDMNTLKATGAANWEQIGNGLQRPIKAISLVSHSALMTAFVNDVQPDLLFAQQVYGYGRKGDVLIALTTSGNSVNVINAITVARACDIFVIGMTGESGGKAKELVDVLINVPSAETFRIQEYHLPVYHALCAMLESELFGN
ncbi:MAG: SIS domain-containing protein [Chitinivibrionales bacterium]|nr:SIS domain-containing protein [Chitinivibrionales bacterium]